MSLKIVAQPDEQTISALNPAMPARKRGRKARPVTEFPDPLTSDWIDPGSFHEALSLHVDRHGDSICHLHKALSCQGVRVERSTLLQWAAGKKVPRSVRSIAILAKIEHR